MRARPMGAAGDLDAFTTLFARDRLDGIDEPTADALTAETFVDHDRRDPGEWGVGADYVAEVHGRQAYDDAVDLGDQDVLTGLGGHLGQTGHDLLCCRLVPQLSQQLGEPWRVGLSGGAYLHAG